MSKTADEPEARMFDKHIGARIHERRVLSLTQHQLAELIGVTYCQAQKCEHGINRISAGLLYEIAVVPNAPITYFYEGLGNKQPRQVTPHPRTVLQISRNFSKIQNEKHQEAVCQITRVLAGAERQGGRVFRFGKKPLGMVRPQFANLERKRLVHVHEEQLREVAMGRGILLWLLGVPIPIIILLALIWH